jgi:hypothetical protein
LEDTVLALVGTVTESAQKRGPHARGRTPPPPVPLRRLHPQAKADSARTTRRHACSCFIGSTPTVSYTYDPTRGDRPTSLTYPDGRTVSYNYAPGLDDDVSRLTSISDST